MEKITHADILNGVLDVRIEPCRGLRIPVSVLWLHVPGDYASLLNFELDPDGRFLHWPHADVHLGYPQLLAMVDLSEAVRGNKRSQKFYRRYGKAIKKILQFRWLGVGLPGFVLAAIEKGACLPKKDEIDKIAASLGIEPNDLMQQIAKELSDGMPSLD